MQKTLTEKTYQQLRRKVLRGELPVGSQLVNRALAEEFDVSLAPVREAIHRLATDGLVEHIPGAGAFVRSMSLEELDELYGLRDAVESYAAAEAARNVSDRQLAELEDVCREFEELVREIRRRPSKTANDELLERWLDAEERFHSVVIDAARNRLLSKVIHKHRALSQTFGIQRHRDAILTLTVAEDTVRGHRAIMAALQDRDGERAYRCMSEHIQTGRQTVQNHLRRSGQAEE